MNSQDQALTISCEFFPPRTAEGEQKLQKVRQQLQDRLNIEYFSVTFGAGGSTQAKTFETVVAIQQQSGVDAAPHLSCIGSTEENIRELLNSYQTNGIKRIVALRGDRPSGWAGDIGDFRYANELVAFIRAETGQHFFIEVAAYPEFHPEAKSAQADINYFQQKVAAGADSAITQYFYNIDAYYRFVDEAMARGISVPIVPGIMPIGNYEQLIRFSDTCGAEVPRWLRQRLYDLQADKAAMQAFGVEVVSRMCQQLLDNQVPGLHFYTLNQAGLTLKIAENLGLTL